MNNKNQSGKKLQKKTASSIFIKGKFSNIILLIKQSTQYLYRIQQM